MLNINKLKSSSTTNWVDIRNVNDVSNWSAQYEDICLQHKINKKWILLIDPEDQSIEQLSKAHHIDTSKILKVNSHKGKVNIKNLGAALSKGNCSAIILSNPQLEENELQTLRHFAALGQTACIVLRPASQKLH
ncbi:hypothetical protein [Thalassotalea sp. G2M2-11]|uniref:hypothetical protein n=1 Tax=Thalassotalea sp. G2M2-11 TaxID=2787627 RepID=UPI0019D1B128|nr:hypothetical protein [Thalassotalea sp. G2M2-11]